MSEKMTEEEIVEIFNKVLECKTPEELNALARESWPRIAASYHQEGPLSPKTEKLRIKVQKHVLKVLGAERFLSKKGCQGCTKKCSKEGK